MGTFLLVVDFLLLFLNSLYIFWIVDAFIRERHLHTLGVPRFYGTGPKHQGSNGKFYRFLVMERCGIDLVELLKNENTVIPQATAAVIACQIVRFCS